MKYYKAFDKYFYSLVLLSLIHFAPTFGQTDHKFRMQGDRDYQEQEFQAAEESYRKSLEEKSNPKGRYNLGNSIYQQSRYEEAIKQYLEAADQAKTDGLKSNAYHNLGNAYYNNQDFKNSIESYKNALRINPSDEATKQNLALAQRKLVQQRQQQQQQNQEQNENEKQNEQQQQQEQQQQENENQNENQNQNEQQQQQQELEQKDLSKEEAKKLLEIMEAEEQKVQEKLRKGKRQKTKSAKDW
jgi:hypothetical protein